MTNVGKRQNSDLKQETRSKKVSSHPLIAKKESLSFDQKKPVKKTFENFTSSQDKILQDLDEMYQSAFANQNFTIALRALELRGKHLGLFGDKKANQLKTLDQMSEEELQALLN